MTHSIRAAQQVLREWRAGPNSQLGQYLTLAGGVASPIRLTVAATTTQTDDGMTISRARHVDYLIEVADLAYAPVAGDRIVLNGKHYAVAAIVPGGRVWEYHGSDQQTYRIHTVQVEAITVSGGGP